MKAISEQAERIKTGFSYEFLEEDRIQKLSDRDEKWATSMSHATVMKSMYTNWMYGGDLFMPIDNGASKFELFSALALYSMSTEEIGDAYVTISDDPDEGISFLMSASQKSAKAILDSKKIEPEKALEVPA